MFASRAAHRNAHGTEAVDARTAMCEGSPIARITAMRTSIIAFSPPFVVTEPELEEMVAIARRAVDEVAAEVRQEA
jgi:adenosylmethionine-8-amino-7-oxononanoate aminotransferase